MDLDVLSSSKLDQFLKDYDVEDLTSGDMLALEELSRALAQLEIFGEMLKEQLGNEDVNLRAVQDLNKIISTARSDISKLQDDLKISRKTRKEKTESVPDFIKDLKKRAKHFLESRLAYIYCPKCKTLLANVWLLDYNAGARFRFVCPNCKDDFMLYDFNLAERTNDPERIVPTK